MDEKIKMLSAVSEVVSFRKKNLLATDEEILQHISKHIRKEKVRGRDTKLLMIAAASRTFEISKKNPKLNDKELWKLFVKEMPLIVKNIQKAE